MCTSVECPACGSRDVRVTYKLSIVPLELSPTTRKHVPFLEPNYICQDCGTEGDFVGGNDAIIDAALEAARACVGQLPPNREFIKFEKKRKPHP